ncbi:MAG: prolyl oligopeptidase family serine peptidase [Holophagales bacterium]|nr:prolyl oligopeptidase family serine peptidase [Holophagales bacterium]MYC08989.1 prolyl oligopeptidase family serine peptidase [Holophagales bacterium]
MRRMEIRGAVLRVAIVVVLAGPAVAFAAQDEVPASAYDRAAKMLGVASLIFNETVTPHWIGDGEAFWYRSDDRDGHRFWRVEPLASDERRRPAFDHARLAASLSGLRDVPAEPLALPFETIDLSKDGEVSFQIPGEKGPESFRCTVDGVECSRVEAPAAPVEEKGEKEETPPLPSPDGAYSLLVRDHDLYLVTTESGEERRLTDNGVPFHDYASHPEARTSTITEKRAGIVRPPSALWSPNGRTALTVRLDQREVGEMHVLQTTDLGDGARPVLHTFRMPIPGDEGVPWSELLLVDAESGTVRPVGTERVHTPFMALADLGQLWWNDNGSKAYLLRRPRGARSMQLEEIDATTGAARTLVTETSRHHVEPVLLIGTGTPNIRVLESGEVLWYSQRDGWAHLYLYGPDGGLVRQVTRGAWVVRDLVHVDEATRTVYFTAAGLGPAVDPYLRTFVRVSLDRTTSRPEILTPEPGDHTVTASPGGKSFVDQWSCIDQPPQSRVLLPDGRVAVELEVADFESLVELTALPEPFTVKARDGKTDIYGNVFFPPGFDPEDVDASYPVIDGIYPGPQVHRVTKNWHDPTLFLSYDLALAQLGFVVVTVDGFGTPLRSKAFHARSEGNLQEAGGLPDHLAAIRQLAVRYPQMDLDRVGVYGHSGGGFASARAIFAYPEFYKVAVSSAGNHDQRGYIQLWGESYHGDPATVSYEEQANASIAHQLVGKLLLAYGALDDNVPPALTLQVIEALTKANRDYDLIVLPSGNHGFMSDPYFLRRSWDYFVRHLAGKEPPADYRLAPPGS